MIDALCACGLKGRTANLTSALGGGSPTVRRNPSELEIALPDVGRLESQRFQ
jgi:hypothetical protein